MFVKEIHEDDWQGILSYDTTYPCEKIEQCLDAVKRLNGDNKTVVVLSRDDENFLMIGGGNKNLYICNASLDGAMYYLTDPWHEGGEIALVAGGQEGSYSKKLGIKLENVLKATELFVKESELDNDLNWELQD
ncbi:hypothetical protein [Acanthopleuribacter pedis]|uniref:Immunity protein Imm1 n=1 Tax=Acanthopleuribacter pedis TaxID=442870 RepID=A0A8J7U2P8_9BACT|nr:hypothetical protein [Acanthopleuribacter pedis]MBO1319548.1 hypothetical protein [Acanthopleuribacter pedis]